MKGRAHSKMARRRIAAAMRRRAVTPEFRAKQGWLNDDERARVIAEIKVGRKHRLIAKDWLIDVSTVSKIAAAAGLSRGRRHHRKRLLTRSQRSVAELFVDNEVVTVAAVMARLYGQQPFSPKRSIAPMMVSNLRRKISARDVRIVPLRGIGWTVPRAQRSVLAGILRLTP